MSALSYSAHDLAKTRLCQAAMCVDDAMPGWALCERCERQRRAGKHVELHVPPPLRENELPCMGQCKRWLPISAFGMRDKNANKSGGNPAIDRQGRHSECKECGRNRRRRARAALDAATIQQLREYDRARQAQATLNRRNRNAQAQG